MKPILDAWLEIADKKTFAGAVDWPGWERFSRDPDGAVARLAEYGPRYGRALAHTKLQFEPPDGPDGIRVVERVPGNATTAFGAPGIGPAADDRPLDPDELDRWTRILEAAWRTLDRATKAAQGVTLTTGPRGGGRSVEKILEHVVGAEEGYLNALGARAQATPGATDLAAHAAGLRTQELAAVRARARGEAVEHPSNTRKLWTPRFFIRRTAWHALDHAWEVQDRSGQAG